MDPDTTPATPPATPAFLDRVAERATIIRPARLVLTLLAVPFYVLGWLLGLIYVAVMFAFGAAKLGIADARTRAHRPASPPASPAGEG